MTYLWEDQTCYPQHHAGHSCPWEVQENPLLSLWGWLQVTLQMCFDITHDFHLPKEGNVIDRLMAQVVATVAEIWVFFLDEVGSRILKGVILCSEPHFPKPSVAYRIFPPGKRSRLIDVPWMKCSHLGLSPQPFSCMKFLLKTMMCSYFGWNSDFSIFLVTGPLYTSKLLRTPQNFCFSWLYLLTFIIWQGSANCGPWAKSSPWLLFVNKVLVEHSQMHLFMYCPWFFNALTVELISCTRDWLVKPKIFIICTFIGEVYWSLI